jgi:hypothetical protein
MIKFIKKILFGTPEVTAKVETVKEILTPPVSANPVNKVKAVSTPIKEGSVKGGNNIVKKTATTTTKPSVPTPANGKKKPYQGKPKASK